MLGLLPPGGSQCGAPDAQLSEPGLAPWRPGLWYLVPLVCRAQSGMWRSWATMGPSPPADQEPSWGQETRTRLTGPSAGCS